MDVYRTEEEQIDFIKRWWKSNGSSVLTGVVLAVAVTVAWQSWKGNTEAKAEAGAALFAQMQEAARAMAPTPGETPSKEDVDARRSTFDHLAGQVKKEHAGTSYAILTAMMLARDAVEQGDADGAEKELRWALEQKPHEALRLIVTLRLARVLAMKGDIDAGLALVQSVDPGAQAAAFDEVKGDLYLMKGEPDKARTAYKTAMDALDSKAINRGILQIKLDDLAVAE